MFDELRTIQKLVLLLCLCFLGFQPHGNKHYLVICYLESDSLHHLVAQSGITGMVRIASYTFLLHHSYF